MADPVEPPFTPSDTPTNYTYDQIQQFIDDYILAKTDPNSITKYDVGDIDKAILDYAFNLSQNPASLEYSSTLPDYLATTQNIGQIPVGTTAGTLRGNTFSKMFDLLLFAITPTLTSPSATLYISPTTGLYIVGSAQSFSGGIVFNQGQIFQPWNNQVQGTRSGAAISYTVFFPNGSGYADIGGSSFTFNYTIPLGNKVFNSRVNYAQGPQPLDFTNENYGSPLPTGFSQSNQITIEGVYPIFGTTAALGTLTQQPLVSNLNTTLYEIVMVSEQSGNSNRQTIQVPTSFGGKAVSKIEYYNPVSQSYDGVNRTGDFIITTGNLTISGSSVGYTTYTYNSTIRGSIKLRFTFS